MKCETCGTEYDPSDPKGCPKCAAKAAGHPGCGGIAIGLIPLALLLLLFLFLILRAAGSATFGH
jgi:hypothetical protein